MQFHYINYTGTDLMRTVVDKKVPDSISIKR